MVERLKFENCNNIKTMKRTENPRRWGEISLFLEAPWKRLIWFWAITTFKYRAHKCLQGISTHIIFNLWQLFMTCFNECFSRTEYSENGGNKNIRKSTSIPTALYIGPRGFFQLVTKVTPHLYPRVIWLNPLPIPICHAIVFYRLQGIPSLPVYLF